MTLTQILCENIIDSQCIKVQKICHKCKYFPQSLKSIKDVLVTIESCPFSNFFSSRPPSPSSIKSCFSSSASSFSSSENSTSFASIKSSSIIDSSRKFSNGATKSSTFET